MKNTVFDKKKVILGIFGGIGSGKSLVLDILKNRYSAYLIEADKVAHKLYLPGQKAYQQVLGLLGKDVLDKEGKIDRKKMGEILFADEDLLKKINLLIHPLVAEEIKEEISRIEEKHFQNPQNKNSDKGRMIIAVEAAVFFPESLNIFDFKLYVYADKEERIARLMRSRSYSREKAEKIMHYQPEESEYRNYCDGEIDNTGNTESLLARIGEILGDPA